MDAMNRSRDPAKYLSSDELECVKRAITKAEQRTTAEIKVVLSRYCWGDIRYKAADIFHKHHLHETKQHNAVLIVLVTTNREFLVYGDRGINQHVGADYWWDVRDHMLQHFRSDTISEGLCSGIAMVGEKLANYFPFCDADSNELSDEVAFDD